MTQKIKKKKDRKSEIKNGFGKGMVLENIILRRHRGLWVRSAIGILWNQVPWENFTDGEGAEARETETVGEQKQWGSRKSGAFGTRAKQSIEDSKGKQNKLASKKKITHVVDHGLGAGLPARTIQPKN